MPLRKWPPWGLLSTFTSDIDLLDNAIGQLLKLLPGVDGWLATEQARFFGTTLFPDLSLCDQIPDVNGRWNCWHERRHTILSLELSLAEDWFSPELMERLRNRNHAGTLSEVERPLVPAIQAQILGYLRVGGAFDCRRLADILNYIRRRTRD